LHDVFPNGTNMCGWRVSAARLGTPQQTAGRVEGAKPRANGCGVTVNAGQRRRCRTCCCSCCTRAAPLSAAPMPAAAAAKKRPVRHRRREPLESFLRHSLPRTCAQRWQGARNACRGDAVGDYAITASPGRAACGCEHEDAAASKGTQLPNCWYATHGTMRAATTKRHASTTRTSKSLLRYVATGVLFRGTFG